MSTDSIPVPHQYCPRSCWYQACRLILSDPPLLQFVAEGSSWFGALRTCQSRRLADVAFRAIPICIKRMTNREIEVRPFFFCSLWRNANPSSSSWFCWSQRSQCCQTPCVRHSKTTASLTPAGSHFLTLSLLVWLEHSDEEGALRWSSRSTLMKAFLHRLKKKKKKQKVIIWQGEVSLWNDCFIPQWYEEWIIYPSVLKGKAQALQRVKQHWSPTKLILNTFSILISLVS